MYPLGRHHLFVAWLSIALVVFPVAAVHSTSAGGFVGVKRGDWAKYSVTWLGPADAACVAFGEEKDFSWTEEGEWIKLEVQEVHEDTVAVLVTLHFRDGNESTAVHSWNLTDSSNAGYHYIIAANLTTGDKVGDYAVWNNETKKFVFVELTLNDTVSKTYGGATREVDPLSFSELVGDFGRWKINTLEFWWDKETGFLLERTFKVYYPDDPNYSQVPASTVDVKIVDTNMWKMETIPDQASTIAFFGSFLAVAFVAVLIAKSFWNKKRKLSDDDGKETRST
jgi:hypothetical protein